jgi:hypothetical protein
MCVIKYPYLAKNPCILRKVLPLIGNILDIYINFLGNGGVTRIFTGAVTEGANSMDRDPQYRRDSEASFRCQRNNRPALTTFGHSPSNEAGRAAMALPFRFR